MPSSHPHFDDRGAVTWNTDFAAALALAKSEQKLVFIEVGRRA